MTTFGTYLVDTSAVVRIYRNAQVREHWTEHISSGLVAICPAVELEVLRAAGDKAARERAEGVLRGTYGWVSMPDDAFRWARDLQDTLAITSSHQGPGAVDLLIAVTARHHGLKVLHYDRDFATIAKAADIEVEWVAPPGSVN
ncbi:PIN domain nuclease [Streptosporangium sp. NBC_01756]|uniref:PIN domain nuclease n=1 Tax=Streptosporangium sp. NBC_01756 TaxID=2975950 RepID=UPI002DDB4FE7|nr:PIN domain nuclease [Streptosporangium sp. NBC_01756]WSC89768.1 PIN domain nuclease [Streptosporangium sp. NBC_01756]